MGSTEENLKRLKREAFSGDLATASSETLNAYAAALCHPQAFSVFGSHEFPQVCETVRIHLLRAHIATLQDHITQLDHKNTKLQWWVIALAIAALVSTITQTVYTGIQTNMALESTRRAMPKDAKALAPRAQDPGIHPTPSTQNKTGSR